MVTKFRVWWQKVNKWLVVGTLVSLVIVIVIVLGYWLKWDWTGFNEHVGPNVSQYQPSKTLWDWLQLLGILAIPIVVGLGTIWFTTQQGKISDTENTDNQREAALQAYIDKMSDLLLEKNLRESVAEDEVCKIARVRTLTVLPRLDDRRKGSVLRFLHESGLIKKGKSIVKLRDADFSHANLRDIDLSNSDLSYANLSNSKLVSTNLNDSDLNHAKFSDANLVGTSLYNSDLSGADFFNADLGMANLRSANLDFAEFINADLSLADLSDTSVTQGELNRAKSLHRTIMADGSIHP